MELIVLDRNSGSLSGPLRDLAARENKISGSMFFRTMEGFISQLRTFSNCSRVAVVLTADLFLLQDLCRCGDLFQNLQVVLVLADHDQETLSAGHRLHPRFLTFADGDVDNLMRVLERILGQGSCGSDGKGGPR